MSLVCAWPLPVATLKRTEGALTQARERDNDPSKGEGHWLKRGGGTLTQARERDTDPSEGEGHWPKRGRGTLTQARGRDTTDPSEGEGHYWPKPRRGRDTTDPSEGEGHWPKREEGTLTVVISSSIAQSEEKPVRKKKEFRQTLCGKNYKITSAGVQVYMPYGLCPVSHELVLQP